MYAPYFVVEECVWNLRQHRETVATVPSRTSCQSVLLKKTARSPEGVHQHRRCSTISTNCKKGLLFRASIGRAYDLPTLRMPSALPSWPSTRQRAGKCHFFEERWSIFLPMTLLYLIAMAAMANKLKGTNDAFNIRNEIVYTCVSTAITSGTE